MSSVPLDLLILGGGASGTAVLQALAAARRSGTVERLRRITLVERGTLLGPGLPYGEAAAPFHTMGRTQTLRRQKGAQLEQRFQLALQRIHAHGGEVEVRTGVEAEHFVRARDGWTVETDRGPLTATNVILATGHWHVSRLPQLQRAVDWRWDVRRLHAAISDEHDVIVLGMGQSGLDAAVALAERRMHTSRPGRIHLASRLGLLPGVFGHVSPATAVASTRHLAALRALPEVRLGQLVAAVRADTIAVAGGAEALPEWTESTLRSSVDGRDGFALLRQEVALARRSHEERRELPWHPVLWHGLPHFHELFPRLPAEDRLLLAAWWTPIMRHVEAIHLGTATRLLGHLEQGRIELHALGESPVISEDARRISVRGARSAVEADRLVDARGPDPRIPRSDDAFLHSVLESGAAVPGRVPFREDPSLPVPEGWSTEEHAGARWLVTGGLWVDPATFATRTADGSAAPGLFAAGPLTVGQFPFYAGLWATRRAADAIVTRLARDA